VLVRPDRFIAWRSTTAPAGDARRELADAFAQVLGRPVDAPVASAVP
jgi:hypothetical protein